MKATFLLLSTFFTLMASSPGNTPAVKSVNSLGVRLLSQLPQGNALISPYSIDSVLVMAASGAAGVTKQEMDSVLNLDLPSAAADIARLRSLLTPPEVVQGDTEVAPAEVEKLVAIADAVYGQKGYPFKKDYLAFLESQFQAPLQQVDFERSPARAVKQINDWVAEQTKDKITDFLPESAIDRLTRLVLVNAVYFRSPWMFPFSPMGDLPFHTTSTDSKEVSFIRTQEQFGYLDDESFELVAIPFAGGEYLFCLWLPKDPIQEFAITPELIAKAAQAPRVAVDLSLPKFRLEPPLLALAEPLKNLGMPTAFNVPQGSADFSGIAPRRPDDYLYISNVFHKTFLDLNENGVEAAAATAAVIMRATALPADPPRRVHVDRPFVFAILHRESATSLFLGRLVRP